MFGLLKSKKTKPKPKTYQLGDFELPVVTNSRRKSIALKHKAGKVYFEVPQRASTKLIQSVIEKHQAFFLRQAEKLHLAIEQAFTGRHGECFQLFGEQYQIQWLMVSDSTSSFELCQQNRVFKVLFSDGLDEQQKLAKSQQVIVNFFKQTAVDYLQQKLDFYADEMELNYQSLTVKAYKSRWGSCYSDGRIQFNWRLMQAPEWVIDYVVVHELAHLVHHNHSKPFWQLVEKYYPLTKAAKRELKIHGPDWIQLLQN